MPEHGQFTRSFYFGKNLKKMGQEPVVFAGSHPHNSDTQLIEGPEKVRVYKFHSMRLGSEKMVKGVEVMGDDARVTAVGRFIRRTKIDEIPQCLNVLKGEMSLIGPRPERVASLADYDEEISKRLNVRPGMTGLAQVSGNIYITLAERYRLDVYYVEHFSLWLDIRILFRTVGVVLLGEERYKDRPLVKGVLSFRRGEELVAK